MQPGLLKQSTSRLRFWRGFALGLSALAMALSGYRALAPQAPVSVSAGSPERVSRAKHSPQPLAEPQLSISGGEQTPLVTTRDPALLLRELSERLNNAPDSDLADAANALATMGGAQAHAALQAATRSRRAAVRDAAFSALISVDTPDVRDFMLAALNEPEPTSAVGYFSDCRDPRALPALERLAHSPVQELSRAALDALLAQGTRAEAALTRLLQADPELADALLSTPPHTSGALHSLRTATIARLREGAINSGPVFDFLERDLSAESREALLFAARDPASADAACTALAHRGDAASLADLSQLANDSDPQLAARASCALASDPDSRSRVPLERAMRGTEPSLASRALVHINAPGARAI